MDRFEASSDLSAEFAFLHGLLATSGSWARSALACAASESPWFAAEVAALAPPPPPNPALALAAGVVVSLPLCGPLAANAGEWADAVRQVMGHSAVDGDIFDFRNGEAVWSDSGQAVSRSQIRAMDRPTRREFYASMGLAAPADPAAEALEIQAAPPDMAGERIRVYRDGREAPVLAAVRGRVAAIRARRQAEYLALVGPASERARAAVAAVDRDAPLAPNVEPAAAQTIAPAADQDVASRLGTLYDRIWAQVERERAEARARGEVPPPAVPGVAEKPASLFEQIWAEVKAERAAARGDGVVGTVADVPRAPDGQPRPSEDRLDVPASSDPAGGAAIGDIADVPPARDLVDASAAFTEPRG